MRAKPTPTLTTARLVLRAWRARDRAPFAALNADPRVSEFLGPPLARAASDALADRIAAHFAEHGFGLWAVEAPGIADFVGFVGLSIVPFEIPARTPSLRPRPLRPSSFPPRPGSAEANLGVDRRGQIEPGARGQIEIGWRLAADHWGHGYATEAARAALHFGFEQLALPEIVSFTTRANRASRAVMERLGMTHDPRDDFDHPALKPSDPLRPHVLYRASP